MLSLAATGNASVDTAWLGPGTEDVLSQYTGITTSYSVENFTAVPSVNTILGLNRQSDYVVRAFKGDDGQLYFEGMVDGNVVRVLDVIEACNGYFYKISSRLYPAKVYSEVPAQDQDATNGVLLFKTGTNCGVSIPQAVAEIPSSGAWLKVWNDTSIADPIR